MAKVRPIQKAFSAGEITPRFWSRPDTAIYNKGVAFLENFDVTPQGSIQKRKGFQFINEISDTLLYGRLFSFRASQSTVYQVVVTEDTITVHDRSGSVVVDQLLLNFGFDDGLVNWNSFTTKTLARPNRRNPTVNVINGICNVNAGTGTYFTYDNVSGTELDYRRRFRDEPRRQINGGFGDRRIPLQDANVIVNLNRATARLSQEITVPIPANVHALKLVIVPGSFNALGLLTDYLSIGTTDGDNDIVFTVDPMESNRVTFTPGVATFWISYLMDTNDAIVQPVVGEFGVAGSGASVSFDSLVLQDTVAGSTLVSFVSPWTEEEVRELQIDKAPGQNIMYFAVRSPTVTQKLTFDQPSGVWTFIPVAFSNPPADWALTGYPGSIGFYQGRLWLAGTIGKPITLWGSVAGEDNYEDFNTVAGGSTDDDSLELPMARDGIIQWIQGGKTLYIGLDNSEHIVEGSRDGAYLTPTTAKTRQQTSYGSFRIHGRHLSDKLIYVSNDQQRVYMSQANRDAIGYVSDELSYTAQHITGIIVETAFGQNPRGHVVCVKNTGELAIATYLRETGDIGWTRYQTQFGDIISADISEEFGDSALWILVLREEKLFLERQSNKYMDSFVIRQYATPTTTVDGLEHLEGQVVQVIGDDAYQGFFPVLNGEITIQDAARTIVAGISISAAVRTLPVEDMSSSKDANTGKLIHWNRVFLRMIVSTAPRVNGRRPPDRTVQANMDETQLIAQQIDVNVALTGRDRYGSILIDQTLPFSTEITGIFGEYSETGF